MANWLTEFYARQPEYRRLRIARRSREAVHFEIAPGVFEAHVLSFRAFDRLADGRAVPASRLTYSLRLMQSLLHSPRALAKFALMLPFGTTFTDGYGGNATTYVDANLDNGSPQPTYNYGAVATLDVGHEGGALTRTCIIQFDVSSIPDSATISAGTMYIYDRGWDSGAFSIGIHRILSANSGWVEGTQTGALAAAGEPCWNAKAADGAGGITTAWAGDAGSNGGTDAGCSVSGTDYNATAIGTFSGTMGAYGVEYTASLNTSQLTTMLTADYGLVLIAGNGIGVKRYCSSDLGNTAYRPKLVVTYTEAAAGQPYTIRGGLVPGMNRVQPGRIGF